MEALNNRLSASIVSIVPIILQIDFESESRGDL